ncbi:poly [ADP-ribose] polymerase 15 [Alligator sinensis]|uniref:Poly [ADP-ribose] polymerase n=1 Tax=Alligator sinensis TaxID=38654 RepID=A0A3Q0FZE3_ALLSI|nr:poly [ADP-ribose] polymerase 15 [Alligator sinensis]
MLILVLETISGLEDEDFSVERIPEIDVAVVTFVKSIDITAFVDKCTQHKTTQELNITVRPLELTRSIKAENVPPNVSKAYLTVYFESPKRGGGPVSDVQQLPEENSAIITFCDHKDLSAVLDKQHFLDETPISVYPYYRSLGTALYGKDRPVVEMPKPITIAVDPYLWQFLQKSDRLLQDISQDMARCHCDLKWPQTESAQPEIMLSPLVALSKQRRLMVEVIPTWNKDATTAFSRIMSQYKVAKCHTAVIVSGIGTDLRLGVGPLSRALLKKAGPALQLEFAEKTKGQVANIGDVFQTNGYNLPCSFLFHVIIPTWDQGKGTALQSLGDIVQQCLKKTQELSLKSITFPAIGSGGFGFPKPIVAKLMFDEVFKFSSNHNLKSLQKVHFLLHPSDTDNIQAFTDELQSRLGGKRKAAPPNPTFFGQVSTPVLGVHEMQIGSITFQVATGDITKEKADAIVNVSNETFNSSSGVSKAILEAAGPLVIKECAQLGAQRHSGFITTQGGKLMCTNIIHLAPHNNIKGQVSKVLQECELKGYKSVTFPAIGTGNARQNPAQVADDMMDAIGNFASKKPVQHVEKIKIVLFQPHMQNDFYAAMQKRGGTGLAASESWYSRITSFFSGKKQPPRKKQDLVLKKKIELAVFQICGENRQNVEDTETWLKILIIKEQSEHNIKNELIETFSEAELRKLNELQEKLHITIQVETNKCPPYIKVSGITRDVYDASLEIEKMIKRIKDDQEEQSKIELVHQIVAWKYSLPDGTFAAFDPLTNMQLEDAKAAKKPSVNVKVNRKKYTVDMNTLHATDEQGTTVTIQRVSKLEDKQSIDLPKEWDDMQQERVKVVQLNQGLPEYQKVQMEFQKTCGFKISKIERIQNPFLWQQYQIKKLSVDNKNGNQNNERCLFHGTAHNSLNVINYNGFNRGFAGKNAAAIGNGTYFAVHANYSAMDTYSQPDMNGFKHMYLARVLTGQYCVGVAGMITPPSKNASDPTDLYDSVVDRMNSPSMFVIFNDIQAYPEYLITFRK